MSKVSKRIRDSVHNSVFGRQTREQAYIASSMRWDGIGAQGDGAEDQIVQAQLATASSTRSAAPRPGSNIDHVVDTTFREGYINSQEAIIQPDFQTMFAQAAFIIGCVVLFSVVLSAEK